MYPQTRLSAVRVLLCIKLSPVTVATWIRSRVCWNLACLLHCSNDTFQDLKNLQKGHDFCLSDEWTFIEWLLFINWGEIALQCCVGFCPTTVWINRSYTYIPSLEPPSSPWMTSLFRSSSQIKKTKYSPRLQKPKNLVDTGRDLYEIYCNTIQNECNERGTDSM